METTLKTGLKIETATLDWDEGRELLLVQFRASDEARAAIANHYDGMNVKKEMGLIIRDVPVGKSRGNIVIDLNSAAYVVMGIKYWVYDKAEAAIALGMELAAAAAKIPK